ncbi:hypothetical protein SBBP2_370001 [Burkholderiales bacterium]|nr:hypothetical protein SBBP2_370001 [Burkholderiales bacterium]
MHAVLEYTGAPRVDIVAHSLGVTAAREWMLQDKAYGLVRSLVAIDGPNHGIIDCSPSPDNYFQLPADGGFVPNSAICEEYGSESTQLLTVLNAAGETPGPTHYPLSCDPKRVPGLARERRFRLAFRPRWAADCRAGAGPVWQSA